MSDRFWANVERRGPADCWPWTGTVTAKGYGRFGATHERTVQAHRMAYELTRGPIPDGLQLDHLCRNRACVNPAHLEPVTNRTNVLRGVGPTAQKAAQETCIRGHNRWAYWRRAGQNGSIQRRCLECSRLWRQANLERVRAREREIYRTKHDAGLRASGGTER